MLIDDIRDLLAAPTPADPRPFLDRVDSTLTAGYAQALQLEAERWRLERRIGEVAAKLAGERSELRHEELAVLAKRLTAANADIASLRSLLSSLRARRTTLRDAA